MARTTVVEAYMTHERTPFITEIRSNGKIRKVGRHQFQEWTVEEQELKAKYGDRWKGVIGIEAAAVRKAAAGK